MSSPAATDSSSRELAKWQRKLLPYMTRFLIVLAAGFFAISMYDVYEMKSFVKTETSERTLARIEQLVDKQNAASARPGIDVVQQSLLILEADAMDKRYRQASALLMSRIWTRHLAFLTGMVLAFIGAIFILGKLSEAQSDFSVGSDKWKGAISSTSPGLILASFGTLLMGIALVVQPSIEVQDRPVYLMTMGIARNPSAPPEKPSTPDAGPINPGLSEHAQ